MGKKKMVLYGAAALFAVSGVVALPSGNITGGIGCIVIAAVCFCWHANQQKRRQGSRQRRGQRERLPLAAGLRKPYAQK